MGTVLSMLMLLSGIQLILGLWILAKAFELSFGWFLVLVVAFLMALAGPVDDGLLRLAIMAGAPLLFVIKFWDEVRTPVALFIGALAIQAVVVTQIVATLAEQELEARTEQSR
jgi:hypothetical protein